MIAIADYKKNDAENQASESQRTKSGSFRTNSAITLVAQTVRSLLLVITWVAIARWLGKDALGRIQLVYVLPITVTIFTSFGLPIANANLIGQQRYRVS